MDRKWVNANRLSEEYMNGVKEFCERAIRHATDTRYISCPCWKCMNMKTVSGYTRLFEHLMIHGIDKSYTIWTHHGEVRGDCSSSRIGTEFRFDDTVDTGVMGDIPSEETSGADTPEEDTASYVDESLRDHPYMNEKSREDAALPLWPGCKKATKLSAVLVLFNLKATYQVSDACFTALLEAVSGMLPDGNVLPRRAYDARKMLKSIGLTHQKIHACPGDCVLFRKEYAHLDRCPKCGEKRYSANNSPAKVMWYFPIISRFRRMYSSVVDARHLTWHHDDRVKDGMLRHPADSPQWKTFDDKYPEFGDEPRHLRLALSTDGMNPFGNQSTNHSTWPVLLMVYNLPPWLCMKRTYMMLSMLISGPKQPGNDIDVYLAPLIEDLKQLWDEGVDVYDAYRSENFKLKAMLFGTINDFPAYGNLAGYSVKGVDACPWCTEETDHLYLSHCKKSVYMGHRRWLDRKHRYRRMTDAFNGTVEDRVAPRLLSGAEVLSKMQNIDIQHGKHFAKSVPTRGWKKQSIFFRLPYWKDLFVRHSIDLMHTQKNVCASLLNTLLADKEKSKDGYNARMDMIDMGIRAELAPVCEEGKAPYLPPAAHTLSKKEKKMFLQTLNICFGQCPTKCFLFLDHPHRCVAIGTLYPQNTVIHNVPLQTGCVRVSLDSIKDEHAHCELPYPTSEARYIGEGTGQFFQWPIHLVTLDTPEVPKKVVKGKEKVDDGVRRNRGMERAPDSPDIVSNRRLGYPMPGDSAHDKVLTLFVKSHLQSSVMNNIVVPIDAYFYRIGWVENIGRNDVQEILYDKKISSSAVTLYLRYLGEVYMSVNPDLSSRYSFARPHMFSIFENTQAEIDELSAHLLKYAGQDHLIFLPVNVGEHWVLIAIYMKTESIYYLDPAPQGVILYRPKLRQCIDKAMIDYRVNRGKNTSSKQLKTVHWTNIQCPRQEDDIHCGYYVGCFVEDIINSGLTRIPLSFVFRDRLEHYPLQRMENFRIDWVSYLYNRFLKNHLDID